MLRVSTNTTLGGTANLRSKLLSAALGGTRRVWPSCFSQPGDATGELDLEPSLTTAQHHVLPGPRWTVEGGNRSVADVRWYSGIPTCYCASVGNNVLINTLKEDIQVCVVLYCMYKHSACSEKCRYIIKLGESLLSGRLAEHSPPLGIPFWGQGPLGRRDLSEYDPRISSRLPRLSL